MPITGRQRPAPRVATIADGVRALVIEPEPFLPRSLDALLDRLSVLERRPYFERGTRRDCTDESHEWALWLTGIYRGLELHLSRCGFCGACEVRDKSIDQIRDIASGRLAPRRRSNLLGWYAGKRPAGRTYV
jgi:hypothetical protein